MRLRRLGSDRFEDVVLIQAADRTGPLWQIEEVERDVVDGGLGAALGGVQAISGVAQHFCGEDLDGWVFEKTSGVG